MAVNVTVEPQPTPTQRLIRLLSTEKKDIIYVYLYAIVAGVISLSLPLGTQAVFTLVSSGTVFSSIYVLIGLVIFGIIVSGLLLIAQQTLVEILQQRVFAKAALEYTYRLPRIDSEALSAYYPPELMNRFFDVLTIQKAMPKLLVDLTTASVQIIFGLLLLVAYHPIFIAFAVFVVLAVWLITRILSPSGIETSLAESKYKYKVVAHLEQMAADLPEKTVIPDNQAESMAYMDELVAGYVAKRQAHFSVIKKFLYSGVAFKVIVVGGLLIMGTVLVVSRQMSLGQFVASELVIVIITGSVDKFLTGIETIFDALSGVEKVANVTDLPLAITSEHHE
jgi:ABC-type bacteriocin/lantibiotic exporter with double-glycine peptidase domain